jgi:hypothetical protein
MAQRGGRIRSPNGCPTISKNTRTTASPREVHKRHEGNNSHFSCLPPQSKVFKMQLISAVLLLLSLIALSFAHPPTFTSPSPKNLNSNQQVLRPMSFQPQTQKILHAPYRKKGVVSCKICGISILASRSRQ